jgi:large conductance mechanosensitive channel
MGILKEFKAFAMKGNVVDMAIGVVIGGAFGKITTSLVNDIVLPPIGLLLGGVNFDQLKWVLREAAEATDTAPAVAAVSINYGAFVQVLINFIIVAWVMFLVVKSMNAMKKKEEAAPAAPPAPSKEEQLLTEIRDLLKK